MSKTSPAILKTSTPNRRAAIGEWLALAGYLLVVLGPLAVLLISTIDMLDAGESELLRLVIPTGRRFTLLLNSVGLALGVSVFAMLLGWMGALVFWIWQDRAPVPLIWLVLPLAALPPYVHAMAWFTLTAAVRSWLGAWGMSIGLLHGWGGSLWVEVATFSPLVLGFAWIGLRAIDPDLVEAGRVARSDLRMLLRIALPLSLPALLTGGGIVFLLSLLDYSVPSLLQVNVYAMEIFAEFSASNSPQRAFLLAMPLLILAIVVLLLLLAPLRRLTLRRVLYRPVWANPPLRMSVFWVLGWSACFILITQALLPLVTLVFQVGTPAQFLPTLTQAQEEVVYSLQTASLTALLSLLLAIIPARLLMRTERRAKLWWFLVLAPVAIPASLVGVGLIIVINRPGLQGDIFSDLAPSIANTARFVPLAVLILLAQMRRRDPLLSAAAQVFQPSAWRRGFQITLPLMAPGIIAAYGLVFALTLGELGATLMVVPPGRATLTMRIYNYLHYGASTTVASLGLALVMGVFIAGVVVVGGAALWSRFSAQETG